MMGALKEYAAHGPLPVCQTDASAPGFPGGFCRTDAVNGLQRRRLDGLVLGTHHAGNGIAVNLFLNFVNINEYRLLSCNVDLAHAVGQRTGLVVVVLDHAEERNVQPQFAKHLAHRVYMADASVQEDQIGPLAKRGCTVADVGKPP